MHPHPIPFLPPRPPSGLYFMIVSKTKLWLTSKGILCFFVVSGIQCTASHLRSSPGRKEGARTTDASSNTSVCHTSANILICKQTIVLCGCWDGRWGEGVSSPQVVRKPPQATGTLTATSAPHVHSSPQHLVSLLIFFLPKISQIWNVLILFLFSFWKKWFILIEPKGWGEPLEHIEAGRWKTGTHLFVSFVCRCSAVFSLDYEAKMFSF